MKRFPAESHWGFLAQWVKFSQIIRLFCHQGKSGEDKICLTLTQLANGVELISVPCITVLLLTDFFRHSLPVEVHYIC